jgi:DNA-binding Xre family transcriptional regulator
MRPAINDLTNDPIVLKIMELLKIQGKTEKDLTEHVGVANTTFTKWKYKGVKSYRKYMDKIAEYLEVTPEYLTEGVDNYINVSTMTTSELRLIQLYRKMSKDAKETLLRTAGHFVGDQQES